VWDSWCRRTTGGRAVDCIPLEGGQCGISWASGAGLTRTESRAWAGKRALRVLACLYMAAYQRRDRMNDDDDLDRLDHLHLLQSLFPCAGWMKGDRAGESGRMTNERT
jgi:hypothetical protein